MECYEVERIRFKPFGWCEANQDHPETRMGRMRISASKNEHFFCKVKEIDGLHAGVVLYAIPAQPQIDAEILKENRFTARKFLRPVRQNNNGD